MSCFAIVPARGGSKGLPRKNLAEVGGRSLLHRSIQTCGSTDLIDRVFVSTDDAEIAEHALSCGAEVILRPSQLSGDDASSESAVLHVLRTLEERDISLPDFTLMVQCTSPFTRRKHLEDLIQFLEIYDCAFTSTPDHSFLWNITLEGNAQPINHEWQARPRRQEMQGQVLESGNAYGMRTRGFLAAQHRFFGAIGSVRIERSAVLEIDTPEDLERARMLSPCHDKLNFSGLGSSGVKTAVFDFDGVLTDNCATLFDDGSEAVRVNRSDGLGFSMLHRAGIETLILSSESNPIVSVRANKLGVEAIQNCRDKAAALSAWLRSREIDPASALFVGNDLNDFGALKVVGFPVCPNDAAPQIKVMACHVLNSRGGEGVVREVASLLCGP